VSTEKETFPRSALFRLVADHPIAVAALVGTTLYFGPARLRRIGKSSLRAISRNARLIAPVLQQAAALRRYR
jgi:hypothetical protein